MRPAAGIFVFALLVAVPHVAVSRAHEVEDKAITLVTGLGGKVRRDASRPDHPIVHVDLGDTEATDADLKTLASFPLLESLHLNDTGVTDDGLRELVSLKQLHSLNLSRAKVSDVGLGAIDELAPAEKLDSRRHDGDRRRPEGTWPNSSGLKSFLWTAPRSPTKALKTWRVLNTSRSCT